MFKRTLLILLRIILFSALFICLFWGLDKYTGRVIYTSPIWTKIQDDSTKIDCLILGNSHAYTSLNAGVLSDALDMEIDILGSSSQNVVVTLEEFKIAVQYQHPEYVILEVYSSFIDNREKLQTESIGILYSALDGVDNYYLKFLGVTKLFKPKNWLDGTFQLFRPTYTWDRWDSEYTASIKQDDHGHVARTTHATGEFDFEAATQLAYDLQHSDTTKKLADYNEAALREFFSLCEDQQISVILYKAPTLRTETAPYVSVIFDIADEYDCVVAKVDYIADIMDLDLTVTDFYDNGHLNRAGSCIVTRHFGNTLADIFGVTADWDHVFSYQEESITLLESGDYHYEMTNFSPDCLYSFRLSVDGEAIVKTPFSADPTFECGYSVDDPDHKVIVTCQMIPLADRSLGTGSPNMLSYTFMKANSCVISEEE